MSLTNGRLHLALLVALGVAFLIALAVPISRAHATETGPAPSGRGSSFESIPGAALVPRPFLVAAGSVAAHGTFASPGTQEATPEATPQPTPMPTPRIQPAYFLYTIQPEDTISSIAAAHGIDQKYILWNNPEVSDDPDTLAVGQKLIIPGVDGIVYHVKLGDTLSDIAAYYKVDVQSIADFQPNNLISPDSISEKTVLLLPGAVPPPPPPVRAPVAAVAAPMMAAPEGEPECAKRMNVYATWYTAAIAGGSGITATGTPVYKGIIAVDPWVIPLGTRMYIPGYGYGVAADTGGAIKGNMIDLGYGPYDVYDWSTRWVEICILP